MTRNTDQHVNREAFAANWERAFAKGSVIKANTPSPLEANLPRDSVAGGFYSFAAAAGPQSGLTPQSGDAGTQGEEP